MGILDIPPRNRSAADLRVLSENTLGLIALAATSATSTGTQTASTAVCYQVQMTQRIGGRSLRLFYTNYTNSGTNNAELALTATLTVKVGILLSVNAGAAPLPVTWGGAASIVIKPGGTALSDVLEIDLPQGTVYWVVTYVSASAAPFPFTGYVINGVARNEGAYNQGDYSAAPNGIPNSNFVAGSVGVYGPAVVFGVPFKGARSARVALVGDDIMRGQSPTNDFYGYNIVPPLSQTSCVNIASSYEYAANFGNPLGHRYRISLVDGCTSWFSSFGTTESRLPTTLTNAATTVATMAASVISCWNVMVNRLGVSGVQSTLTPYSTSSDSYATTANQTIGNATGNTARVGFNNWLRNGAPMLNGAYAVAGSSANGTLRAGATGHPLVAYFEVAHVVESARDSGLFKAPGYTPDGYSLNPSAYTAISSAVDWTKLGIV